MGVSKNWGTVFWGPLGYYIRVPYFRRLPNGSQNPILIIKAPIYSKLVNPIKLETGLWPNRAGIPYTLLLRVEAMGFTTFGLLL